MDTAQIHDLASKVREFDRKTEETRSQLQRAACHPNPRLFCNAM
jgi:hypothetical protein